MPDKTFTLFSDDNRGVQWTVQAFIAGIILLSTLAITMTTIPIGQEQSSEKFVEYQQRRAGQDLLRNTAETGALKNSTLYWNAQNQRFVNSDTGPRSAEPFYTTLNPSTSGHPLWPAIRNTLRVDNIAYNIDYQYETGSGIETQRVVFQGTPGENAVSVTYSVYLNDDDIPEVSSTSDDGDPCRLGEMNATTTAGTNGCASDAFFAPDAFQSSGRYNIVKVRLVLWRA